MSQENKILEFMRNHGTITQREAFYLGCQRLASRICDLKKRGIVINKEMIPVKNADGTKHRSRSRF